MDFAAALAEFLTELGYDVENVETADPAGVDISFTTGLPGAGSSSFSAEAQLDAVADLAAVGVTWCSTGVPDDSMDAAVEALERYGAEVIARQ